MNAISSHHPVQPHTGGTKLLRRLAWIFVFLLALYFFFKYATHYFVVNERNYGPYWQHWGALLLHIVGGTFALLLGPLQFWTGLRQRFPRFHRLTGRLYFAGIVLGSAGSLYLSTHSRVSQAFGVALFALTLVWLISSTMALVAILRRQVATHKEWVTRSYVLTFAFVTGRLLLDSPFLRGMANPKDRMVTIIWLCWTIPLFITEIILQWRRSATIASNSRQRELGATNWDGSAA
jgi:hypothetical protein